MVAWGFVYSQMILKIKFGRFEGGQGKYVKTGVAENRNASSRHWLKKRKKV